MPQFKQKNSAVSVTYGLDIGGTKIEIGLFNDRLNKIDSWRVATPTDNYDEFLATLCDLIIEADRRSGHKGVIGIGIPGIIGHNYRLKSANVPCVNGKNVAQDLQQKLGRKVVMANDCRLFALSESCGGSGQDHSVVFGAVIGTGAAGGLCINGKLLKTSNNIAGEYGHLPVSGLLIKRYNLPLRQCGCGLQACIECYIAGPGLAWLYKFFGENNNSTFKFVEQLRLNDTIARKTFNCYMDLLGSVFASLVLTNDPDVIVLGGGLSNIDEIITSLPAAINKHLFDGVTSPAIKRATFGDSSGARGAAILGAQYAIN
jgi:N-acetylglucosamine kinase